jgi:tRNA pseudouridine38-40 synthase
MRYFFEIGYDGGRYHGWQSQQNATGIQEIVENTLSKLLREEVNIIGSGRTDSGVHCVSQFFHVDFKKPLEPGSLLQRINSFLPKDIVIRSIRRVKSDAHARYDARLRKYEYQITRVKDPFQVGRAFYFFRELDVSTMNQAASLLIGEHDFQCFSKVKTDVNHFICDIKRAEWNQKGNLLVFTITANRFLRGMVRATVGTLLDVGTGKINHRGFKEILRSKDRKKAGMNVPAEGLYLVNVAYPKQIFLDA